MFRNDLTQFIEQNLTRNGATSVAPDESLIDAGILTSMALIRLVGFIETRTGIKIPDGMITPDNFETVSAIERTVADVRSQRAV